MATRLRPPTQDGALRAELAARARALAARYAFGLPPETHIYLERARAIERGEPVLIAGWELRQIDGYRGAAGELFVVEADGTVRDAELGTDTFDPGAAA